MRLKVLVDLLSHSLISKQIFIGDIYHYFMLLHGQCLFHLVFLSDGGRGNASCNVLLFKWRWRHDDVAYNDAEMQQVGRGQN